MAPRKLRTPPYCAWYCFVSLVLAIVGAGLYKTDASPACDLVGCLPEGLFAPNEAGWAIYQRSDY